jgi:DNA-binding IclR family transcriptional regulator
MLDKAMALLELFQPTRTDLGVVEAAELLGMPKSTASRRLTAMEASGFLDRDPVSQRYHLGIRLVTLGHLARQATPLQRAARSFLAALTEATGETSDLVLLRGREAVNVEAVESPRPMKHVGWAGRHIPLHATAAGKSLLAWLPEATAGALVELPLMSFTPRTIHSLEELLAELKEVRRAGYSTSIGEFEEDLVGVAAPVMNHLGEAVASITIGAPASRAGATAMPHLIRSVVDTAEAMSAKLGHQRRPRSS